MSKKTIKLQDMMDLLETLDLGFTQDKIYGNKIDDTKEKTICVYKKEMNNRGYIGSIDTIKTKKAAFSILLHWTKSYNESENKAQEIYDKLESDCKEGFYFGDFNVIYLHLVHENPIQIERSADGTWEFILEIELEYYT